MKDPVDKQYSTFGVTWNLHTAPIKPSFSHPLSSFSIFSFLSEIENKAEIHHYCIKCSVVICIDIASTFTSTGRWVTVDLRKNGSPLLWISKVCHLDREQYFWTKLWGDVFLLHFHNYIPRVYFSFKLMKSLINNTVLSKLKYSSHYNKMVPLRLMDLFSTKVDKCKIIHTSTFAS